MNYQSSVFTLAFLLISIFIPVTDADTLVGSWQFNVQQAPWEYNKGTIEIEYNDVDDYHGKIVFHTGREVPIEEIYTEEESVTFDVVVEGYDIKAVGIIDTDKLHGYVVTVEGKMDFVANKQIGE